jgi:serine/threonine protein phosphatase 1
MSRTFAIGDIHGCHQVLNELLERLRPHPEKDTIVILGDFINRGPGARQTIDRLLALQEVHQHLIVLRGNHEQMFLDYLAGCNRELFSAVGGRETLASYGLDPLTTKDPSRVLPSDHLEFLASLPALWEDEHAIYVHAGLEPGVHLAQQSPAWLLWARDKFLDSAHDFGKPVVFGHTPFAAPRKEAFKIGIDTGAVYGGRLTCLILPDLEFVSVPSRCWWPRQGTEAN